MSHLALLATIAGISTRPDYGRMVDRCYVDDASKADYLFTSGRPGRYNPRGVEALYASEDLLTAGAEADRYRKGETPRK